MSTQVDLIIIGSGPGGYPAAAEAVSQGLSTVVIERGMPGGTCLNCGCIPTKAMCRSAEVAQTVREARVYGVACSEPEIDYQRIVERRDEVVQQLREGVTTLLKGARMVIGEARFTDPHTVEAAGEAFTAPRIIIATGATPARLDIPGGDLCLTSDDLLQLTALPKSMIVIGGGVIGLEFASIFNALGVKVTVVEYCPEILPPFDAEVAKRMRMALRKRGIDFQTGAAVTEVALTETGQRAVTYTKREKAATVEAECVLMAVGRRAVVPAGIELETCRGAIVVDPATMQTSVEGVYAVGDCNGICQLAHAATAQAMVVMGRRMNLNAIPAAVFTTPEAAMVGLTEQQALAQGMDIRVGRSTFRANGKALAMGEPDGMVKIVIDRATDTIVGAHILGPHAADLIAELALAVAQAIPVHAISSTIHAHPTLAESILPALS